MKHIIQYLGAILLLILINLTSCKKSENKPANIQYNKVDLLVLQKDSSGYNNPPRITHNTIVRLFSNNYDQTKQIGKPPTGSCIFDSLPNDTYTCYIKLQITNGRYGMYRYDTLNIVLNNSSFTSTIIL